MKKSQFNTLLTENWGDITSPKRTPAKDRAVAEALRDEIYSLEVVDTDATTNQVTKAVADVFTYEVTLKKTGNGVYMRVYLRNKTSSAVSPQNIFTWNSGSPFKAKSLTNNTVIQCWNNSNRIGLSIGPSGLFLMNSLSPSTSLYSTSFEFYIPED